MKMKNRILIVDDEEGIRFTLNKFLTKAGYEVVTAESFDEAVICITDSDFDVIFADIILKGKTGIDVLREIKSRGISAPVIMITGYPNIDTASEAIRLGAFDYIPKPIQKDALFHAIDVALQYKTVIDEREKYRTNLEAIFRSVKDAIISVNKDLEIIEVNESATKICGITRDSIGKKFSSTHSNCSGKCLNVLTETLSEKKTVEFHSLECSSNGKTGQIVSLNTSPLLDRHNTFSGAIMVISDETRLSGLERELNERQRFHKIIGRSEEMQEIYSLIELLTDVETTVLINGESGTGKELVAEALHFKGTRSEKPIIKVNCSALTESLLESELFGHIKGSFTGAIRDKIGRFESADGGTIFLDEIADISPKIQVQLLRVLQEKEIERVGDSETRQVDVRVVTATNQNLSEKVKKGEFREDLFYRLNVMRIIIPPLRDRREDIPLLVDHFLDKFNMKFNKKIIGISSDTQKMFMNYEWRGNVRELEHAIEHAFILCRQQTILPEHLPPEIRSVKINRTPLNDVEIDNPEVIMDALEKASWNKTKAAEILGVSRRSIYRKIKEFNIEQDITEA